MKPIVLRAARVLAALSLAACGTGGGHGSAEAADSASVPAGEQVAPGLQQQAAPQTGANTPQANAAEAPAPGSASGRTYASCMREAAGKGEGERDVLARSCRGLPGAPKP